MKKSLLFLLLLLLPVASYASEYKEFRYSTNTNTNTCTITGHTAACTGDVTIPSMLGGCTVTSIDMEAFYNCTGLTSITIPNSVTSIGYRAFYNCTGLTSITIPNGVTSIEMEAFAYCSNLTSITIPNSVKKIESLAFVGCSGLTSITIPNSVISIEWRAFMGCTGLTSITIPKSVTSIEEEIFMGCTGLTSINVESGNPVYDSRDNCNGIIHSRELICGIKNTIIPNSVFSIGERAFRGCTGLTSITIPNSVISIGRSAFSGCTGLTSITIPNSVTSIGMEAFAYCSNLTSITIPNSVTEISPLTFSYCSGLTSVTIPKSVTSIGETAFKDCTGLTSVTVKAETPFTITDKVFSNRANATLCVPAGSRAAYAAAAYWKGFKEIITDPYFLVFSNYLNKTCSVTGYRNDCTGNVTIPSSNGGYSVTSIGKEAFKGCTGLTSITIPNSVTSIGESAFLECYYLTSITIPNSVTEISPLAFSHCWHLTSITIPNSMTSIGKEAFKDCTGLTSITIPNSVTSIGESAFQNCSNLTSITIPNSVTSIGESAFVNCSNLTSITIPNSVTTISRAAFSYCSKLRSITIPNSVTEISPQAFLGCKGLTSITIPNSVTSIGERAFCACTGLTSITIPNSVTSIGESAFGGCSNLTSITIPNSVTSIGESAFVNCSNLTSITIPNSVTFIGQEAFGGCTGLTSITIPNSVTSIGESAFTNCSKLISVTVKAETPLNITYKVFTNRANATLYVPAGSKAAYEAAKYWKEFKEIIEVEAPSGNIVFASDKVKAACVAEWDTNGDGELSYAEAAAATRLIENSNAPFAQLLLDPEFTSFDEFQYFTGITYLFGYEFRDCENLTSIKLPNSITSIGIGAFRNCPLTSIHIPASVTNINMGNSYIKTFNSQYLQVITVDPENTKYTSPEGSNAIIEFIDEEHKTLILGCGNTDFTKLEGVTTIRDQAFQLAVFPESKTSIILPATVTEILYGAFDHTNITSINLGDLTGLTTLGDFAFTGCKGLTEVTIPASITNRSESLNGIGMGDCVFYDCTNIVKVVSEIEKPFEISKDMSHDFNFCTNNAVLYVPKDKVQDYIGNGWEEIDNYLKIQSFRVITAGDSTVPEAITGLTYNGSDQKLILPGTYRNGMMEYSLDGSNYSTSVPTGKEAGEYTVYYRKVGESDASILKVTIAAPKTISVFSGSNLWAGYVATENLAIPTGLEAYVITNLGATTATASSLNYIPQGVPVLLKRNNASVNDYEISTGTGTAPTVNLLKTYDSDKSVSNREGFILYNDEFVLVNEGTLPAGRVFLPANGSGRALTRTIVFDRDDIVDFGDSQENNDDSNQWYDIQGRKLERKPTKKGIYILDGRKVVIK